LVSQANAEYRYFFFHCFFYIAYVISGLLAKPDWPQVFRQMAAPSGNWNLPYTVMLVGLVGTTIAPWMQFYLQSSIVEKGITREEYKHIQLDVVVGCILAPVIAFFIVVACAATLFQAGVHVESAQDAAVALRPLAGPYASWLFAFGLFNASIFASAKDIGGTTTLSSSDSFKSRSSISSGMCNPLSRSVNVTVILANY